MSKSGDKFSHLFRELRRRKTIRVAAAYIFVAWALAQGAELVLDAWEAEPWVLRALIVALVVGLGVAIVVSWVFDITPEGLERTEDVAEGVEEEPEQPEKLKRSVSIELGSAHRRQVSVVNGAIELLADGEVVSDPEAMHAVLPQLEQILDRVSSRYAGYRLDDSAAEFEILFGYPVAREDDAGRAVAASLSIVEDIRKIEAASDVTPAARLTVHTDFVVVEESGSADDPITVVGATSRVASWLQALSAPHTVTLTDNTYELLRDRFRCESLGEHRVAPLNIDTMVYRALELTAPADSLIVREDGAHAVVGRDSEIALLLDRWDRAIEGEGQFVVLRGEPGIGKSTLVRRIVEAGRETEGATVMPLYCSPFDSNRAFHPVIEYLLGPALGPDKILSDKERERKIEALLIESGLDVENATPLMAMLLSLGDKGEQAEQSGEIYRTAMQNCLLQIFKSSSESGPIMLIFEDLHWADPSTLEILGMLVTRGASAGAFCLFTTRPALTLDWESRSDVTTLDLQRLSQRVTRNLVSNILGDTDIPEQMVEQIVSETGGNPLFAEELTKAVTESVSEMDDGPDPAETLSQLVLPGTLQQSLAARIDNLGSAKPLLQLCSLLGREFDYRLLRAVSQTENEAALQDELRAMVNAEFLFQTGAVPDSRYVFKHILMQETAYESLLKKTRTKLHAQVAEIIEEQFPETAERHPQMLAFHYGESGDAGKSVGYWMLACKASLDSYANLEAIIQADTGLRILATTPDSVQRDSSEVTFRMMRGRALVATRGYSDSDVERNFAEALALCEKIGDAPEMFQLLVGLWMHFFIRAELEHSQALARRLVRIAEAEETAPKIVQARYCLGFTLYSLGEYAKSRHEFELALAAENPDDDFASESASGDDTRTHVRSALAHVLWHLGHLQSSLEMARDALELAHETGHPYAITFNSFMSAFLFMLRREPDEAAFHSETIIRLAEENVFNFWPPLSQFVQFWSMHSGGASANESELSARIEGMANALDAFNNSGGRVLSSTLALQVVEELIAIGEIDRATVRVDAVDEKIRASGEFQFIHDVARCRGLLAKAEGDISSAEEFFIAAQQSARAAGSVSLALRAATDLAQLQSEAGDENAASRLLDSAYGELPEQDESHS